MLGKVLVESGADIKEETSTINPLELGYFALLEIPQRNMKY